MNVSSPSDARRAKILRSLSSWVASSRSEEEERPRLRRDRISWAVSAADGADDGGCDDSAGGGRRRLEAVDDVI